MTGAAAEQANTCEIALAGQGLRRQVKDEDAFPVSRTGSRPRESIPTNRAITIRGKRERQKICWVS
jgi:hypothetical protein